MPESGAEDPKNPNHSKWEALKALAGAVVGKGNYTIEQARADSEAGKNYAHYSPDERAEHYSNKGGHAVRAVISSPQHANHHGGNSPVVTQANIQSMISSGCLESMGNGMYTDGTHTYNESGECTGNTVF